MPLYLSQSFFVLSAYARFERTASTHKRPEDLEFINVSSYINWTAHLRPELISALPAISGAMDVADAVERLSQRQAARDEIIKTVFFGNVLERYPDEVEKTLRAVLWDFMYAMSHAVSYTDHCRLLNERLVPRVYAWFKHAHPFVHSLFLVADVPGPEGVKLARMEPSVMHIVCSILTTWVPR
ncbi:hypothetical protein C4564_05250 [Candidatus Microgenomates bacterium]|nr:MAG: hypothetical protein C4564_05250 [Candidatus Microgenomates bacterium]